MIKHSLFFFIVLLIPFNLFAASYLFDVVPTDLSVGFIFQIFGPISSFNSLVAVNAISTLMGAMGACLVSGSLMLAGFIGFKTAFTGVSDGHVFGERMSSLYTPAKIVGGMAFLIPDSSGYSAIQHFVIWAVLNGVGFANQLWNQILVQHSLGNTLTMPTSNTPSSLVNNITQDLYYVALASAIAEFNEADPIPVYNNALSSNYDSKNPAYICAITTLTTSCDNKTALIEFPIQQQKNLESSAPLTSSDLAAIFDNVVSMMKQDMFVAYAFTNELVIGSANFVDEKNQALKPSEFFGTSACYSQIQFYNQYLIDALAPFVIDDSSSMSDIQTMMNQGWMSAALYYWKLNQPSANLTAQGVDTILTTLSANNSPATIQQSLLAGSSGASGLSNGDYPFKNLTKYYNPINNYLSNLFTSASSVNSAFDRPTQYSTLINDVSTSGLSTLMGINGTNALLAALIPSSTSYYAMNYDFSSDRFSSFIQNNIQVITTILTLIQTLSILAFILMFCLAFMRGMFPGFVIVVYIVMAFITLFFPFLTMLIGTAIMGSLYASALPGLIFSIGVMSWFMKVIEAVVAAPIVSLAMMMPNEDDMGKITHAMMQLLVIALKPSLMILGFVIAAKMCQISIMFTGGAFNYLGEQLSSIGTSGGMIFLVMMYEMTTLLTVSAISRSFNIINLLPEQVFMMMGVQGGDHDSQSLIDQFESAAEQGGEAFSQIMSSLGSMMKTLHEGATILKDKRDKDNADAKKRISS